MVHSLSGQARLLASAQTPFGVSHIQKFCAKVPKPCRRGSPHTLRCSEESVAANSGDSTATTVSNGDNITAPEQIMKGRQVYDPQSYETLVQDATKAVLRGITAGENRIEVEFPPPGGSNSYKSSSDQGIDGNIQLALAAASRLNRAGRKVRILLADSVELNRAQEKYKYSLETAENVTIGHTAEGMGMFGSLFGGEREIPADANAADTYIVINHSSVELPAIEKYADEVVKDKILLLWNLELDTLRADLGLLGFPSKELQYRFLAQFLPVFYVRKRDYSKSIGVAPFLVNYTGMLLREFPADWQVMLRQDDGSYACIAEDKMRFTLFDVKEELLEAAGLNTEEKGSTMEFLRKGYKRSTWWEDAYEEEQVKKWRS